MTKKLGTADLLAKLALSILTLVSYAFDMISGPLAKVLVILAAIVLIIYMVKVATDRTEG